jgi:hypothetical protein
MNRNKIIEVVLVGISALVIFAANYISPMFFIPFFTCANCPWNVFFSKIYLPAASVTSAFFFILIANILVNKKGYGYKPLIGFAFIYALLSSILLIIIAAGALGVFRKMDWI